MIQAGSLKPALAALKTARRHAPRDAELANLSGVALSRAGNSTDAVAAFRKATRLQPAATEPRLNLARLYLQLARHGEALRLLEQLHAARPIDPAVLRPLAFARLNSGDAPGAIRAATACLEQTPDTADMLNLRASARVATGQTRAALKDYGHALALSPDNSDFHANMALPLFLSGQHDQAIDALGRAISLNPNHLSARHRLGVQLAQLSRMEDARAAFYNLLAIAPGHAEALRELSLIARDDDLATLLKTVRQAASAKGVAPPDQSSLGFAEATLLSRLRDPETPAALARANALARKHRRSDPQAEDRAATAIIETTAHLPTQRPANPAMPRPVFILGLPRSGSTLVEQMLTAHPDIQGLGEHVAAEAWMQSHAPDTPFTSASAETLARAYSDSLPDFPEDTRAFTDKMPGNFRLIGHLATAFPDAVFIHVLRDPADSAWSLWANWFASEGMNFSFDQSAMARYFNLHARMMAHWHSVCGPRIATLRYETLVRDPAAAASTLAGLAGVAPHPGMTRPEQNPTPVRTASRQQVRQPMHQRSVGMGTRHADHLRVFLQRLSPEAIAFHSGAGSIEQRQPPCPDR